MKTDQIFIKWSSTTYTDSFSHSNKNIKCNATDKKIIDKNQSSIKLIKQQASNATMQIINITQHELNRQWIGNIGTQCFITVNMKLVNLHKDLLTQGKTVKS